MSNVTNAILTHGWEAQAAEELQNAIARAGIFHGNFTRVDQHAGGPKAMAASVHIAGFNHLDEPALLATIRGIAWEAPEFVQLFLKRQDDHGFTEVTIFGLHEPIRQRKLAAGRAQDLNGPPDQLRFHEKFASLMEEYHRKTLQDSTNPLRPTPWGQKITEAATKSEWQFEVLEIRPEFFFKSGTRVERRGLVYIEHSVCGADLAYRGAAAELRCDRANIGDLRYENVKGVLSSANVGDTLAFGGKVCVTSEGI